MSTDRNFGDELIRHLYGPVSRGANVHDNLTQQLALIVRRSDYRPHEKAFLLAECAKVMREVAHTFAEKHAVPLAAASVDGDTEGDAFRIEDSERRIRDNFLDVSRRWWNEFTLKDGPEDDAKFKELEADLERVSSAIADQEPSSHDYGVFTMERVEAWRKRVNYAGPLSDARTLVLAERSVDDLARLSDGKQENHGQICMECCIADLSQLESIVTIVGSSTQLSDGSEFPFRARLGIFARVCLPLLEKIDMKYDIDGTRTENPRWKESKTNFIPLGPMREGTEFKDIQERVRRIRELLSLDRISFTQSEQTALKERGRWRQHMTSILRQARDAVAH